MRTDAVWYRNSIRIGCDGSLLVGITSLMHRVYILLGLPHRSMYLCVTSNTADDNGRESFVNRSSAFSFVGTHASKMRCLVRHD
jgi:hypothetical protein